MRSCSKKRKRELLARFLPLVIGSESRSPGAAAAARLLRADEPKFALYRGGWIIYCLRINVTLGPFLLFFFFCSSHELVENGKEIIGGCHACLKGKEREEEKKNKPHMHSHPPQGEFP